MISLPLTVWMRGALSRSESAHSSSAAPLQPAPHMMTMLLAASISRTASETSALPAACSGFGQLCEALAKSEGASASREVLTKLAESVVAKLALAGTRK